MLSKGDSTIAQQAEVIQKDWRLTRHSGLVKSMQKVTDKSWTQIRAAMFLKTGPDQPVQPVEPSAGPISSSDQTLNLDFKTGLFCKKQKKPRLNRKTSKTKKRNGVTTTAQVRNKFKAPKQWVSGCQPLSGEKSCTFSTSQGRAWALNKCVGVSSLIIGQCGVAAISKQHSKVRMSLSYDEIACSLRQSVIRAKNKIRIEVRISLPFYFNH